MSKPENPPAFPSIITQSLELRYGGMTLRDYFAAKALVMNPHNSYDFDKIAEHAYKIADAMLIERQKS